MRLPTNLPITVSPDLRVTADREATLTPGQALAFAEKLTLAAMQAQAALMQPRRSRRLTRLAGGVVGRAVSGGAR